ncbi:hypothetical protein BRAS3809_370004 [Bradyrhizobium sp. STM 3809]|nr:hypothetical protein BRAS3809_370004 [Bradyrhizobium sp. STM 3809]
MRNSSSRISPGWGLCSRLILAVVVDDFDMRRSSIIPDEANSPLIVDPDRMLPDAVGLQSLEPVPWRHSEIVENPGLIKKTKFAKCDILNVGRQSSAPSAAPYQLRLAIREALDHDGA